MALGPTHYRWRRDVQREVQAALSRFSALTANTYVDHPWPGWDEVSADFWGPGGRGDPIPEDLRWRAASFLLKRPGKPFIRHLITEHSLWTSYGGWSYWSPKDHSGRLGHLHVTWWK